MDYKEEALELHRRLRGKIAVIPKLDVLSNEDLSLVYSPGVAWPCLAIRDNPASVYDYTIKGNTVAIVTDGSAVLGLGNIGATASIPVMEGKAMLFKRFARINAFPICLDTQDQDEIVETVRRIAPVFGGINLEDISSPRSFYIEEKLQDLGIPVFHDDQHGTAIVVLAALINASKVIGKPLSAMNVVINGAGAAGIAIARLLGCVEQKGVSSCSTVNDIIICDSVGIIHKDRMNLSEVKRKLLEFTNKENRQGGLKDAMHGFDVFVGVSKGNLMTADHVRMMSDNSVILALANPIPEIMPDEAKAGGARIVGTGRSDFPNQVNNVLGFPGIFRGALEARAPKITAEMKLAAARAIASCVEPTDDMIIPPTLNEEVAFRVARAVYNVAMKTK
jgi:malate dehydrogenase (oxaloacetate-decarboxylating)